MAYFLFLIPNAVAIALLVSNFLSSKGETVTAYWQRVVYVILWAWCLIYFIMVVGFLAWKVVKP